MANFDSDTLIKIDNLKKIEAHGESRWVGKVRLPSQKKATYVVVLSCDDNLIAIPEMCPHQGDSLAQARVSKDLKITCPSHAQEFCLKSELDFVKPVFVLNDKFFIAVTPFQFPSSNKVENKTENPELEQELEYLREANQAQQDKILSTLSQMDSMLIAVENSKRDVDSHSDELRSINMLMQRITDSLSESLIITDNKGRITQVNKRGFDDLQATESDLIGQSLDILLHLEELKVVRAKFGIGNGSKNVLYDAIYKASHFEEELTLRFNAPDEVLESPHHLVHGAVLYSDAGKQEGMIVLGSDISNLKRREKERLDQIESARLRLHESETRFRDFAETASDWFWELDENLTYSYFSSSSDKLTDEQADKVIGTHPQSIQDNALEREQWQAILDDLNARRPIAQAEYRVRIANEIRDIRVSGKPLYDSENKFTGYRGTARDITESKEAENQLLILSSVVEQSPSMILITDTDGIIEYVNPQFLKFTGYELEEMVGQSPRILQSEETPVETYVNLWNTIISGEVWRHELKDRCKDGRLFWASVTIAPVKNAQGRINHYIAIHEDITDRKISEGKLHSAMQQADVANRAKSELLANMSHELRTPLNAIIGFSKAIQSEVFGPLSNDKYFEYINDINNSGEHLLKLINDILDVSAIEAGKLLLHEESVDISDIIDASIRIIKPRADLGEVEVNYKPDFSLPLLNADERRLKQIFLNILSNAVKFTDEGGSVNVDARTANDGGIVISFSDTGVGMTDEELAVAMSQFGQTDTGFARKHEGTGLGLPLTKNLVELHDGIFTIVSEKSVGTTVSVTFPRNRVI